MSSTAELPGLENLFIVNVFSPSSPMSERLPFLFCAICCYFVHSSYPNERIFPLIILEALDYSDT